MNWKVRKPNFCLNNWLKEFIELIMMERAASILQDLYREGLDGPWTLIKKYLSERNALQERS